MRKKLIFVFGVILCISLVYASFIIAVILRDKGNVSNVELHIGTSNRFTQEEIMSAMHVAIEDFSNKKGWNDELVSLEYNETHSNWRLELDNLDKELTIVIFADWYQGTGIGNERVLGPWAWILSRESSSGSWVVVSQGKM